MTNLKCYQPLVWNASSRPPCYAFEFDFAFVLFELRLTENRSIEIPVKYLMHFAIVNESAASIGFVDTSHPSIEPTPASQPAPAHNLI